MATGETMIMIATIMITTTTDHYELSSIPIAGSAVEQWRPLDRTPGSERRTSSGTDL
jgi:hypothetical protein